MILLFNNLPVESATKVEELIKRVKSAYGSDYYQISGKPWLGDKLSVESLFPNWILKKYNEDSENVLIIPIIKNYLRWLFSIDYGYGASLEWETLRVPLYMNDIFLEALADFYFPGANFAESPLNVYLTNIHNFSVKCNSEYFPVKGTPKAIKYLVSTIFDIPWNSISVTTTNSCLMEIAVSSFYYNRIIDCDQFLKEYVYPAGIGVIYRSA
jgi:hypothetical protein